MIVETIEAQERDTFIVRAETDDPKEIDDARSYGRGVFDVVAERDREGITTRDVERGIEIIVDRTRSRARMMIRDLTSMLEQIRMARS